MLPLLRAMFSYKHPSLEREVFGVKFPNPVGLAAGFDKNGDLYREMSAMGFGFVEVGTVTPKSQPGNPKPRIFRLKKDNALINRMGFPNKGLENMLKNLRKRNNNVVIGVNLGKNSLTSNEEAPSDYLKLFRSLYEYADYFVVNVNYGLCPEYQCPVPHRQLVAALNWVGANAEKLGLDLDRMIVSGDSAGGYYGAMLAAITLNPDLQAKMGVSTSLKFGGAVLNCGIYDVATALKNRYPFDLGGKLLKDFAGIGKDEIEGYEWKDLCSVLPFVNEQFPASFITHAQKDIFCGGQADGLMKLLKEKGVHCEEFHSTSLIDNHCFSLNWKSKAARKNNDLTADFMKRFAAGKI